MFCVRFALILYLDNKDNEEQKFYIFFISLQLSVGCCIRVQVSVIRKEDRRIRRLQFFLKSSPSPNAINVNKNKIELSFDEIVTLKDPSTKIVVSPAQTEMPKMSASGKKVTIELIDTLLDNTTYTIDFSNSIQDNNEGNPLENFAFAFSTGSTIDSLRVSGIVLNSQTLEPQQNVIVGLHSNLSDTAFTNIKLERIARTNSLGQFVVRNVKPGKYHIFAINDVDRDYKFANPTEDIAFYDSIVVPTCTGSKFRIQSSRLITRLLTVSRL